MISPSFHCRTPQGDLKWVEQLRVREVLPHKARPWSVGVTEMLHKAAAAVSFATGVPDVNRATSGEMAPASATATWLSSETCLTTFNVDNRYS